MTSEKIEFAVSMTCQNCVDAIKKSLSNVEGIKNIDISLEHGTVVVDTSLPFSVVQDKIEKTGRQAVLKGYGENNISAVSMIGGNSGYSVNNQIYGVIRFVQTANGCIVDGTVDGLNPGNHGLHIHECGDISEGCKSVGDHYNPRNAPHGGPDDDLTQRHVGDLGNINVSNDGRAVFKKLDKYLDVSDIIGRALVITDAKDDLGKGGTAKSIIDGNSGNRIACGIIARSSGLFQNTKKICACDGLTLWDERDLMVKNQNKHKDGLQSTNL